MRIAIDTHGCRLNQAESDALAAALVAAGHSLVTDVEHADSYVLNTCTITHEADADARAAIRRARRRNPAVEIVVTGCAATGDPEPFRAMAGVHAVVGNPDKQQFRPLLAALERPTSPAWVPVERLSRRDRPPAWLLGPATEPARTRPFLKVQDGCDLQCSFCIVPTVRGRSRSLPLTEASDQLSRLLDHPEVVLTGAHLGSWASDRHESSLASLVRGLLAAHPSARLRLGSVDPHEVEPELIETLGLGIDPDSGAGLCQHIHLPVQSGDDEVLRSMRRAHTAADLAELIPRLRRAAPDVGIGTDVIVGFPGESDSAFERTLTMFERTAVAFAHVFVWSPRAGTPAVRLPGRVESKTAALRSRTLRQRVALNRAQFVADQFGRVRSAVIQRTRDPGSGQLVAWTDNAIDARLDGSDEFLGRRAWIRLGGEVDGRISALALALDPVESRSGRRVACVHDV